MCGIFGCFRLTDVTRRMLPYLAWEMEGRGKDSWGGTNGYDIIKHIGPITNTWYENIHEWEGWDRGIFHTRAASTGAVTRDNQHPFTAIHFVKVDGEEVFDKQIVGIHNGIVTNHDILNNKYKRGFDCDSPHIFEAIVGNSPTQEVQGYGNLAWYEIKEGVAPVLHVAKFNATNLEIVLLKTGEIVFASNKDPIERAAKMAGSGIEKHYGIEGDMDYIIREDDKDPSKDCLYREQRMPFGVRTLNSGYDHGYGTGTTYNNHNQGTTIYKKIHISMIGEPNRSNGICHAHGCTNKVKDSRQKNLICEACFTKLFAPSSELCL